MKYPFAFATVLLLGTTAACSNTNFSTDGNTSDASNDSYFTWDSATDDTPYTWPGDDSGDLQDATSGDDVPIVTDGGGAGESCMDPIQLILASGTVTYMGSSTGFQHDHDGPGACSNCRMAIDMVFAVDVPAATRLRIRYTGMGGTADCIAAQRTCPTSTQSVTCGVPSSMLTNPRAGLDFMANGTAYLYVWMDRAKPFTLEVLTEPLPVM